MSLSRILRGHENCYPLSRGHVFTDLFERALKEKHQLPSLKLTVRTLKMVVSNRKLLFERDLFQVLTVSFREWTTIFDTPFNMFKIFQKCHFLLISSFGQKCVGFNHQQMGIFPVACGFLSSLLDLLGLIPTEVSQGGHDLLLNQGEVCCVEILWKTPQHHRILHLKNQPECLGTYINNCN